MLQSFQNKIYFIIIYLQYIKVFPQLYHIFDNNLNINILGNKLFITYPTRNIFHY